MKYFYVLIIAIVLVFIIQVSAVVDTTNEMIVTQEVTGNLDFPFVAYIYTYDNKIDQKIVSIMEEMGFTVDLIDEHNLPLDLSKYRFIFVGDEGYINHNKIPVDNFRSIVANYPNTDDWGLTDNDGPSQTASTSPLRVFTQGSFFQVYTQAFSRASIGIPYYYLGKEDKPEAFELVAAFKKTSSGTNYGDVISYVHPNTALMNGKIAKQNICYFGIIKSQYWTDKAEEMFKDCVNFVAFG